MAGLKQHPIAVIDYLKRLVHTPRHLFPLLMAEQVFGKLNPPDEGASCISGHFAESVLVSQFGLIPVRRIRQITVLPTFLVCYEAQMCRYSSSAYHRHRIRFPVQSRQ